jgi:hypothetical protein
MWEIRQMKWKADHPQLAGGVSYRDAVKKELGGEPDLELVEALYRCEGAAAIDRRDEDAFNLWRVELDGVTVRFTEEHRRIVVIVEGRLAEETLHALQEHVLECLSALHFTAWELEK